MAENNKLKRLYWGSLFFIALSGFAQMPIFKRYYIADIPGLGWLAKFYVTHIIHYLSAIVLIALVFYLLTDFFIRKVSLSHITKTGYIKLGSLFGLIVSGGLMTYKNMPGIYFNHALISILDLTHLGLCMLLLITGLYSVVKKKTWVKM